MTNLTSAQIERIAKMDAADAACWTAWYTEQNQILVKADKAQQVIERAILGLVKGGMVEPTEVRKAVAVPARSFNAAVRFLKVCGSLQVDPTGLMFV